MTDAPVTPTTPVAPVVIPAPAKDQPGAWHWAVRLAIILPFISIALFVWVQAQLQPSKWCGVATGAAKITDTNAFQAVQACFDLMRAMLEIYSKVVLGLILLIAIGNLGIIYTALKAKLNVEAWGIRGGIGGQGDGGQN
jgi:hypothetical protein